MSSGAGSTTPTLHLPLPRGGSEPDPRRRRGVRKMGLGPAFSSDDILGRLFVRRRQAILDDIRRTENMNEIDVPGEPVTTGAVIFDPAGQKILLVLDGYRFNEGKEMWVVPKGARVIIPELEPSEVTARREVLEETSLDLPLTERTPFIQVFTHRLIRLYLTIARADFESIMLDTDESVVVRWFRPTEVDDRYMNLPTKKVFHNWKLIRARAGFPEVDLTPPDPGVLALPPSIHDIERREAEREIRHLSRIPVEMRVSRRRPRTEGDADEWSRA